MSPTLESDAERPALGPHLTAFAEALAEARPDAFGHLLPRRILFVAGAARRAARATIRGFPDPVTPGERRPEVLVRGQRIRYEICLRPRFFLGADPDARVRILAHELWHIAPELDGRLHPKRRHGARPEAELEAELDGLLEGFEAERTSVWPLLQGRGERQLSAWLVRPPGRLRTKEERSTYDERDLYDAILRQE